MNTIKFLIVVSIALISTDLIYHQVVNAQGQNQTGKEEMTLFEEMERYFSLEPILNYCYEHASDSANPVQDLRDKGLLDYSQGEDFLRNGPTTYYNYTTCAEVKQESDRLNDYAEKEIQLTGEPLNDNNTNLTGNFQTKQDKLLDKLETLKETKQDVLKDRFDKLQERLKK